jgi:hypothetical protein
MIATETVTGTHACTVQYSTVLYSDEAKITMKSIGYLFPVFDELNY